MQGPKTGDIIYRPMIGTPWQSHYGVYLLYGDEPHVLHNSAGGVGMDPLDKFLHGRKLRGVITTPKTGSDPYDLIREFVNMPADDFNIFVNNCEQWAHRFTDRKQVNREFALAFAVAVLAILALKASI